MRKTVKTVYARRLNPLSRRIILDKYPICKLSDLEEMKDFIMTDWHTSTPEQRIKSTIAYITLLKQSKGITNRQICDATKIPDSTFDKFMSGNTLRPDWINVIEVIRFLGGSVDTLCGLNRKEKDVITEKTEKV